VTVDDDQLVLVRSLVTRTNRNKLIQVDLKLPHPELTVKKKYVNRVSGGTIWTYKVNEDDHDTKIVFGSDLGDWFASRPALRRAPVFHEIYGVPYCQYTYATELRCKNTRAPGEVGGWNKDPTHVRFYFADKDVALLFKLTWAGL
jgi:hypothetical protein